MKTYENSLVYVPSGGIFVFFSNLQGKHLRGSALAAKTHFHAQDGTCSGFTGKCYAIYTYDLESTNQPSVKIMDIVQQIATLYDYAFDHPKMDFYVASGINEKVYLSGYTPHQMATIFSSCAIPQNMVFEKNFSELINSYVCV